MVAQRLGSAGHRVIVTNLIGLGLLVHRLASNSPKGGPLLVAAMQVWLTDVIGFALLYWELDRGGPVARRTLPRSDFPPADWRFSLTRTKTT